jgi:hypothetical protein
MWSFDETSIHDDDDIVYDALVQPISDTFVGLTTEQPSFPVQSHMQVGSLPSNDSSVTTTFSSRQGLQSEESNPQEVFYYEEDYEPDAVDDLGIPGSRNAQGTFKAYNSNRILFYIHGKKY